MPTTSETTMSGDGQIPAGAILQGNIYQDDPLMHTYDFQEENSNIQPAGWDVKEMSEWLDNIVATIMENDSRGSCLQMQQEVFALNPTNSMVGGGPCGKLETETKSAVPEAALEGGVVNLVHPTVDTTHYYWQPSDCQDADHDLAEKQTSYLQEAGGNVLPVGWDENKKFSQNMHDRFMEDDEQKQGFPMQHEVCLEDSEKSALGGGPCSEMHMERESKFSMPETSLDKEVNNLVEEKVDGTQCSEEHSNYQDAELPEELQSWEDDWILKYPPHSQNESTVETAAASDVTQISGHNEANVEMQNDQDIEPQARQNVQDIATQAGQNDQDISPQAGQQQWDRSMAGSNIQVGSTLPRKSSYGRPRGHKPEQLVKLRKYFENTSKYIEYDQALTLSNKTKMSVEQIQTFFNNERNRQKRIGNTNGLKKDNRHSVSQKAVLEEWVARHSGNLNPKTREKDELAQKAQLSLDQVSNWFENRRKRQKKAALREGG